MRRHVPGLAVFLGLVLLAGPAFAAETFNKAEYAARRARLMESIGEGAAVFLGAQTPSSEAGPTIGATLNQKRLSYRKSLRGKDGHPHADAVFLRHRAHAGTAEHDSHPPLSAFRSPTRTPRLPAPLRDRQVMNRQSVRPWKTVRNSKRRLKEYQGKTSGPASR